MGGGGGSPRRRSPAPCAPLYLDTLRPARRPVGNGGPGNVREEFTKRFCQCQRVPPTEDTSAIARHSTLSRATIAEKTAITGTVIYSPRKALPNLCILIRSEKVRVLRAEKGAPCPKEYQKIF